MPKIVINTSESISGYRALAAVHRFMYESYVNRRTDYQEERTVKINDGGIFRVREAIFTSVAFPRDYEFNVSQKYFLRKEIEQ